MTYKPQATAPAEEYTKEVMAELLCFALEKQGDLHRDFDEILAYLERQNKTRTAEGVRRVAERLHDLISREDLKAAWLHLDPEEEYHDREDWT